MWNPFSTPLTADACAKRAHVYFVAGWVGVLHVVFNTPSTGAVDEFLVSWLGLAGFLIGTLWELLPLCFLVGWSYKRKEKQLRGIAEPRFQRYIFWMLVSVIPALFFAGMVSTLFY